MMKIIMKIQNNYIKFQRSYDRNSDKSLSVFLFTTSIVCTVSCVNFYFISIEVAVFF